MAGSWRTACWKIPGAFWSDGNPHDDAAFLSGGDFVRHWSCHDDGRVAEGSEGITDLAGGHGCRDPVAVAPDREALRGDALRKGSILRHREAR